MPQDENKPYYNYDRYANWRICQFNAGYPHLTEAEFSSKEEYKAALIEQYRHIREDEYNAICYNTGLEMYRDSMAVINYTHDKSAMNSHIWNGLKGIPETVVAKDSTARRVPEHVMYQYVNTGSSKQHSCAITGSTVVQAICDEMGCEDNMVHYAGEPGKVINYKDFQYWHTGAGHFMFDPQTEGYRGRGNMAELVADGSIGPGDRISSSIGSTASNSSSGKHERMVIAVDKDDKGNVIGYTTQANNNAELTYHKIPDKSDSLNNSKVEYASTRAWTRNQIDKECLKMENMPVQKIQEAIEKSRQKTVDTLRDTTTDKERELIEGGINPKFSQHYKDVYTAYYTKYREQEKETWNEMRHISEKYKEILGPAKVVLPQEILKNEMLNVAGKAKRLLVSRGIESEQMTNKVVYTPQQIASMQKNRDSL